MISLSLSFSLSLSQYLIAVVLIVILEIIAGILGFVYRDQVVSYMCLPPSHSKYTSHLHTVYM